MSIETQTVLAAQVEAAAQTAGLAVAATVAGADFSGNPTTRFTLARASEPADAAKTQVLELSDSFDFARQEFLGEVQIYLSRFAASAR